MPCWIKLFLTVNQLISNDIKTRTHFYSLDHHTTTRSNLGTNSHLGSTAYLRYTNPTHREDQLNHVLTPLTPLSLTGKSDYSVINSTHFASTISHEKVHDNEVMVSFDVESLFTKVTIEDAVQAA